MDKEFLLIEEFLPEEANIQIIKEEKNGKTSYRCRGRFQLAEAVNKNQRNYSRKILEREVNKLKPMVEKGQLLGELDHPSDRINTKLSEAAIIITALEMKDNEVIGEYIPANTPKGKILEGLLADGIIPGISSRGAGRLVKRDNVYHVTEDFNLRTWDVVENPSTEGCYPALIEGQVIDIDSVNEALTENSELPKEVLDRVNNLIEFGQYDLALDLINEVDTSKIKAVHPGILELKPGEFEKKGASYFQGLAKRKGQKKVMGALLNLERWNKKKNPSIAAHARKIIDAIKVTESSKEEMIENLEKSIDKVKKIINEENNVEDIKPLIIKFFSDRENAPVDDEVHDFADELSVEPDEFENSIYSILFDFIKSNKEVGKHNDVEDSQFDESELKRGIEVEKEHTDNEDIAKRIAKDHLSEISDYYTRLDKMEKDAGVTDSIEEANMDGTGPEGKGPKTGYGEGPCNQDSKDDDEDEKKEKGFNSYTDAQEWQIHLAGLTGAAKKRASGINS